MPRVKKQKSSAAKLREEKAQKFKSLSEDITNYVTKHRFHEIITGMMSEAYTQKTDNPWEFMVNYIISEQNLDIASYYNAQFPIVQNENTTLKNENMSLKQENISLKIEIESLKNQLVTHIENRSNIESLHKTLIHESPIEEQQSNGSLNNFPTVIDNDFVKASNEIDDKMAVDILNDATEKQKFDEIAVSSSSEKQSNLSQLSSSSSSSSTSSSSSSSSSVEDLLAPAIKSPLSVQNSLPFAQYSPSSAQELPISAQNSQSSIQNISYADQNSPASVQISSSPAQNISFSSQCSSTPVQISPALIQVSTISIQRSPVQIVAQESLVSVQNSTQESFAPSQRSPAYIQNLPASSQHSLTPVVQNSPRFSPLQSAPSFSYSESILNVPLIKEIPNFSQLQNILNTSAQEDFNDINMDGDFNPERNSLFTDDEDCEMELEIDEMKSTSTEEECVVNKESCGLSMTEFNFEPDYEPDTEEL